MKIDESVAPTTRRRTCSTWKFRATAPNGMVQWEFSHKEEGKDTGSTTDFSIDISLNQPRNRDLDERVTAKMRTQGMQRYSRREEQLGHRKDNLASLLTKPVGGQDFKRVIGELGFDYLEG